MSSNPNTLSLFDRLERAFARYASGVLRHRWLVLALVLGVTAVLAYTAATRLRIDTTNEGLLGSDSPAMLALDGLTETFGPDKTIVLAIHGDVYSRAFLARLVRLHDALAATELELASVGTRRSERRHAMRAEQTEIAATTLATDDPFAEIGGAADTAPSGPESQTGDRGNEVFEDVRSLVNAIDLESRDGTLESDALLATLPNDLPAFRARVEAHPGMVGSFVDTRGRLAVIVLRPRAMDERDLGRVVDETVRIVAAHQAPGFRVERSGFVALNVALNRMMERDMVFVFVLALVVMIALLTFLYRNVGAVVTPIAVIVLSIVATHGAMAIGLAPVTVVTSVLATMLLVIGMADAVHVVSAYRDRLRAGASNDESIVHAIAETAWPITFTAITDVAGLIGFRTSSLESIRDMGTYGSIGILAALAYTLTLLPVLLSFHRARPAAERPEADRERDFVDRLLDRCETLSRPSETGARFRRRNRVLLGAFVLSVVATLGALRTTTVHDPLTWFPRTAPERVAVGTLESHGLGTTDVSLVIRTHGGRTLRDPDLIRAMRALEADILTIKGPDGRPFVTKVVSVLDLVRDANGALVARASAMPEDRAALSDAITLVENASPSELSRIATADLRTTRMVLSVRWFEASAYAPFARAIRESAARRVGSLADVEPTGSVFAGFEVVNDLNGSLRGSFFTAVLAIAFTMILLVFSVRIGLLAMIPNLVPILGMLGTMGLFGLPLDMNGLLVGSIAMGLVVDDTIHVVHAFVRHRATLGVEGAVRHVFLGTGRALIGTGLVLAAGFAFFLFAELENVRRFGGLLALSIVIALIGDLVLTPAVLRCLSDAPSKAEDEDAVRSETAEAV